MTSISIPAGVEQIDPAFFQLFPNAASVMVAGDNPRFQSFNGMLFTADLANLLLVPEGMEGVAVLPGSLATVPAYVISRCKKLYGLTLTSGSTGSSALTAQDGILYTSDKTTLLAAPAGIGASVAIAPECTTIAEGAFWGNDGLKTIISNGDVSDIAAGAENAESEADAPAPASAFAPATIETGTVITEDRSAWEAAGFTHFAEPAKPGDATTLAPDESGFVYTLMEDGHLSVKWVGDAPATGERTIVESATLHGVNYTVTTIEDGAFRDQTELTKLTLPSTITSIGDSAFAGCTALGSIQIPGSTISIGASAFEGCTSLAGIALGGGLRMIGERAFAGTALEEIMLPTAVQEIGAQAFADCAQLRSIIALGMPSDVDAAALQGATNVNIYVPSADVAAFNPGAPAAGNHLLPYGVTTGAEVYTMLPGDTANAFTDGGSLQAPEGVEVALAYKASTISAEKDGQLHAMKPGTSSVTYTLSYRDRELAKVSCAVVVNSAPKPAQPEAAEPGSEATPEDDEDADPEGEGTPEGEPSIDEEATAGDAAAPEEGPEDVIGDEPSSGEVTEQPDAEQDGTDIRDVILSEDVSLDSSSTDGIEDSIYDAAEEDGINPATTKLATLLDKAAANLFTVGQASGRDNAADEGIGNKARAVVASPVDFFTSENRFNTTFHPNTGTIFAYWADASWLRADDDNGNATENIFKLTASQAVLIPHDSWGSAGIGKPDASDPPDTLKGAYFHTGGYVNAAKKKELNKTDTNVSPSHDNKFAFNIKARKTGYDFDGWRKGSATGTVFSGDTELAKNLTLYASWKAHEYTFTFDDNGGTGGPSSIKQAYDATIKSISKKPTWKNSGKSFNGYWYEYTDASGNPKAIQYYDKDLKPKSGTYTAAYSITLKAHWTNNQFQLTFNDDGGSGGPGTSLKATYDTALPVPTTGGIPSKANYVFQGYYTAKNGAGTKYYKPSSDGKKLEVALSPNKYTSTAPLNLYAHWTGEGTALVFNANGGYGSTPSTSMAIWAEYGAVMPDIGSVKPYRTGYTFLGWYDTSGANASGGHRYYDQNNAACQEKWLTSRPATGQMTLYAHWGYKATVYEPIYTSGNNRVTAVEYPIAQDGTFADNVNFGTKGYPLTYLGLYADNSSSAFSQKYNPDGEWSDSYSSPSGNMVLFPLYSGSTALSPNGGEAGSMSSVCYIVTAPYQNGAAYNRYWLTGDTRLLSSNSGGMVHVNYYPMASNWQPTKDNNKFKGFYTDSSVTGTPLIAPDYQAGTQLTYGSFTLPTLYAGWLYARYTIVYRPNGAVGGSAVPTSTVAYAGTNPTISQCLYRPADGTSFVEWNTKADGSGTHVPGSTTGTTVYEGDLSTANGAYIELFAIWRNHTYSIVYHPNDGHSDTGRLMYSDAVCNTTVTINKNTYIAPDNYHFSGFWNTKADGSGTSIEGSTEKSTTYNRNLTHEDGGVVHLYAQWDPNIYNIRLSNKHADKNGTSSVYLKFGVGYYSDADCKNPITKIDAPERLGYSFGGYAMLCNGQGVITDTSGTSFEESTGSGPGLDPTWNAITYTIRLHPNFAESADTAQDVPFTFDDLDKTPRPSVGETPFDRDYFEFNKWTEYANGTGTSYGPNFIVTRDLAEKIAKSGSSIYDLYAQWTQVAFNVTFVTNGGTPQPDSQMVRNGTKVTEPGASDPDLEVKRPGYTLEGWYKDAKFTGKPWDFATDLMPNGDLTLYAKWKNNTFMVTFDPGRGTGEVQQKESTYEAVDENGDPVWQNLLGIDSELGFSRTGGRFSGWSVKPDPEPGDKIWTNGADVRTGLSYGEPVTLYAQWDPVSYHVLFMANAPADSAVDNPADMGLVTYAYRFPENTRPSDTLKNNEFTCSAYSFDGWNTAPDGSGISFANGAEVATAQGSPGDVVLQDLAISGGSMIVVLYAQWKGAEYTVHFEPNVPEGEAVEGEMPDQTLNWGVSQPLNPNEYRRPGGWVFGTWNTQPDGSGTTYADGASVRNLRPEAGQDRPTLYAQWRITFNVDVPTVDRINVTMNTEGEWITVDSTDVTIRSYSPLPVGIKGISCEGTDGLSELLQDTSQANQLVLNLNSQGTTVPLSAGTTSTDADYYFRLEKGSLEAPATLPMNVDLATRNPDIGLKEHPDPITAFRLTFMLGVVQD